MDENTKNINKEDILKQTRNLIDLVENAYKTGTAAHKVEQDIFLLLDGVFTPSITFITPCMTEYTRVD